MRYLQPTSLTWWAGPLAVLTGSGALFLILSTNPRSRNSTHGHSCQSAGLRQGVFPCSETEWFLARDYLGVRPIRPSTRETGV